MKRFKKAIKLAKDVYSFTDLKTKNNMSVELVGSNWTSRPDLPVAILYGFNPWKRQYASQYLKEYRTAFVKGKSSFFRVKKTFINYLPENTEIAFIGWSKKLPRTYYLYSKFQERKARKKIKVGYIEDGFLRSIGSGLLHTKPCSLAVDWKGMHFDSRVETDLECLLKEYSLSDEELQKAESFLDLFKNARLTKYYNPKPYDKKNGFEKKRRHAVLVLGQVEDDASVLNSASKVKSNASLIAKAVEENPNSDIFYRPHPDYYYGTRKGKKIKKELLSLCAIIPPDSSLYEVFEQVDTVYTISSLSGFEALIFGLDVKVFGAPFYSGWGLTNDEVVINRRNKELSLEEIFYISYFIYPRYMGLETDSFIEFEDLISEFLVESLKHERIFDLKNNKLYRNALKSAGSRQLSVSFKVLKYIVDTDAFSAANVEEVMGIIEAGVVGKSYLYGYSQISVILLNSANYSCLVEYTNRCLTYIAVNIDFHKKDIALISSFFYALTIVIYRTRGRPLSQIPDINLELIDSIIFSDNSEDILVNYFKCLIANLQYGQAESLLDAVYQNKRCENNILLPAKDLEDKIKHQFFFKFNQGALKKMLTALNVKPGRSERDYVARHRLLERVASLYGADLNEKFRTNLDFVLNNILVDLSRSNYFGVKSNIEDIHKIANIVHAEGEKISSFSKKRLNHLTYLADIVANSGKVDIAKKFLSLFKVKGKVSLALFELKLRKFEGDAGEFYKYYDLLSNDLKNDPRVIGINALFLREKGLLVESCEQYRVLEKKPGTIVKKLGTRLNLDKVNFCIQSSDYLNSIPQPKIPKGVVIIGSHTCFNTLAMMLPSYIELKKKGYAIINLTSGMTENQPTGIEAIDRFSGIIPMSFNHFDLHYDWLVDWEKKNVMANGINFYQGFYENLSNHSRRYFVDINVPSIHSVFVERLYQCDLYLKVCDDVYTSLVKKGIPVALVSGNSHVVPYCVMRDFAREKNDPNLSFINCNVAYEAYFSNLGSKFANTMCVTDMTLYPNIRAPFMARKDKFDIWYDENKDNAEYLEKASSLIKVNRVGSSDDVKELEVLDVIRRAKEEGKKIVCAFGKVPVDLNVPYDGGPAHQDMADWITHTVEVVAKSNDILLLVKPHPHELRPEIALDLVETFADLIKVDIPENVLVLGHKDINGHALAPYLDLALLYNGSSALELTAQGVPVMLTSYFGRYDYPVDLCYPSSRSNYEQYLLDGNYLSPAHETRKKSAFLMCYLGTEEVSTINQYSLRPLTNDGIGIPKWRKEKMNNLLIHGDVAMERIADQVVEKFEIKPSL
ncbi:hypothetical protein P8S55_04960 [Halomonas sp. M1]|uniref:capsular polysaccharide export protein, LipB/KpsS family n=1 Tax=Halomonas sp. M1 TaxID=3035470 RepID=UPI0024854299|nr:hypothetical protein [Halomonas sp. M1]WFE72447.1 hypothetical protein P8S55_04960 [Halomonas sp. M1]